MIIILFGNKTNYGNRTHKYQILREFPSYEIDEKREYKTFTIYLFKFRSTYI